MARIWSGPGPPPNKLLASERNPKAVDIKTNPCYLLKIPKELFQVILEYVHDVRDVARLITAANNHELRDFLLSTVNAEESGLRLGLCFVPKKKIDTWMLAYHIGISTIQFTREANVSSFQNSKNSIPLNLRIYLKSIVYDNGILQYRHRIKDHIKMFDFVHSCLNLESLRVRFIPNQQLVELISRNPCLTSLNIVDSGEISDLGLSALSGKTFSKLSFGLSDYSWSPTGESSLLKVLNNQHTLLECNISAFLVRKDSTLQAIADQCKNLRSLAITIIDEVTGEGLQALGMGLSLLGSLEIHLRGRALSGLQHCSLQKGVFSAVKSLKLQLYDDYDYSTRDSYLLLFGCINIQSLHLQADHNDGNTINYAKFFRNMSKNMHECSQLRQLTIKHPSLTNKDLCDISLPPLLDSLELDVAQEDYDGWQGSVSGVPLHGGKYDTKGVRRGFNRGLLEILTRHKTTLTTVKLNVRADYDDILEPICKAMGGKLKHLRIGCGVNINEAHSDYFMSNTGLMHIAAHCSSLESLHLFYYDPDTEAGGDYTPRIDPAFKPPVDTGGLVVLARLANECRLKSVKVVNISAENTFNLEDFDGSSYPLNGPRFRFDPILRRAPAPYGFPPSCVLECE